MKSITASLENYEKLKMLVCQKKLVLNSAECSGQLFPNIVICFDDSAKNGANISNLSLFVIYRHKHWV